MKCLYPKISTITQKKMNCKNEITKITKMYSFKISKLI